MLFKLSNLNSNLSLTLGYLNPALNNSALVDSLVVGLFRETAFLKSLPCYNVFSPIYEMYYLVHCFNLAIHPLLRHLRKKKTIKMLYPRASKTNIRELYKGKFTFIQFFFFVVLFIVLCRICVCFCSK